MQVYYGILKHKVDLVEEKNKLEMGTINEELLDNSRFAGNYNIPHSSNKALDTNIKILANKKIYDIL